MRIRDGSNRPTDCGRNERVVTFDISDKRDTSDSYYLVLPGTCSVIGTGCRIIKENLIITKESLQDVVGGGENGVGCSIKYLGDRSG